jgi:hypothetical protein
MLDPWIIEEILRREREGGERRDGERAEVPLESPRYRESETPVAEEGEGERGVIIIDI